MDLYVVFKTFLTGAPLTKIVSVVTLITIIMVYLTTVKTEKGKPPVLEVSMAMKSMANIFSAVCLTMAGYIENKEKMAEFFANNEIAADDITEAVLTTSITWAIFVIIIAAILGRVAAEVKERYFYTEFLNFGKN